MLEFILIACSFVLSLCFAYCLYRVLLFVTQQWEIDFFSKKSGKIILTLGCFYLAL